MASATKIWPFGDGFSYIDTKGKRRWSRTKPTLVGSRKSSKMVGRTMATKRRRRRTASKPRTRRAKDKRVPILPLLGVGAAMSKPIENAVNGNYVGAAAEAGARLVGYNFQSKKVDIGYAFWNGWLPIVLGAVGSKVATKLGVNRTLKKVPFVGKYIKL